MNLRQIDLIQNLLRVAIAAIDEEAGDPDLSVEEQNKLKLASGYAAHGVTQLSLAVGLYVERNFSSRLSPIEENHVQSTSEEN